MHMEIVNCRTFGVPRAQVYAAFANPEYLARWWGPAGFTNRIIEFDLRPGGNWRIIMRGPDGAEYDNHSKFIEVVGSEKVVYEHLQPMHRFLMTMTFGEPIVGKTALTWRMLLDRSSEHEQLRDFISGANEQNFDRLEAFLAGE